MEIVVIKINIHKLCKPRSTWRFS